MATLLRTYTFTTPSINPSSSSSTNQAWGINTAYIVKIKVTPSNINPSELTEITLYKRNTFLVADTVYNTVAFAGILIDPIETDGVTSTERNEGFVCRYEDLDAVQQLHIKVTNIGTVAKTYTIVITCDSLDIPLYASNTAALLGGLPVGAMFRTGGVDPDIVCVVHA